MILTIQWHFIADRVGCRFGKKHPGIKYKQCPFFINLVVVPADDFQMLPHLKGFSVELERDVILPFYTIQKLNEMKKVIFLIIIVFTFFYVSAKTYVLVHGQGGQASDWSIIAKILISKGHKVIVLNLPGHGNDKTDIQEITIQGYCQRVIDSIIPVNGKVILVAHSMGGMVITKVTDIIPDRIEKLVYLTALLPKNGQSMADVILQDSTISINPVYNSDTTLLLKHNATINMGELGCNDCPVATKAFVASMTLRPSPAKPIFEKVYFNKNTLDTIPKYFICATEDRMISYSNQLRMISENNNVTKTFTLNMGHLMPLIEGAKVATILEEL
ncbi:alpha/beta fold hydrolase [Flavitalea antarctica]